MVSTCVRTIIIYPIPKKKITLKKLQCHVIFSMTIFYNMEFNYQDICCDDLICAMYCTLNEVTADALYLRFYCVGYEEEVLLFYAFNNLRPQAILFTIYCFKELLKQSSFLSSFLLIYLHFSKFELYSGLLTFF